MRRIIFPYFLLFFPRGQVLRLLFICILFAAWLGETGIPRTIRNDLVFQIFLGMYRLAVKGNYVYDPSCKPRQQEFLT
jgi:hypothetical protein